MTSSEMLTSEVSARIGIVITAQLLRDLGFEPVRLDKRAVLWAVSDYPRMCSALAEHIASKSDVPRPDNLAEKTVKKPTEKATSKGAQKTQAAGSTDDDEEL